MICEKCDKKHDGTFGSGRFCSQKCASSFSTKNKRKEINQKVSQKIKQYFEDDENSRKRYDKIRKDFIIKECLECNKKYKTKKNKQKFCSKTCFGKYNARQRKLGGHTSKLKIYYTTKEGKTVYLQSSYELKVAENLDENNIKWERPKFLFWEDEKKIKHRYYPDFYLIDFNIYLDPKNDYLIKKDKEKIQRVEQQNNVKVFVLDKNNLDWNNIKRIVTQNG